MTTPIVIEIDPHENGFCAFINARGVTVGTHCVCWAGGYCTLFGENAALSRSPSCLAAEAKLRALIEAGQALRNETIYIYDLNRELHRGLWDRALAALEGKP